jgi:hypothetical protein
VFGELTTSNCPNYILPLKNISRFIISNPPVQRTTTLSVSPSPRSRKPQVG